MLDVYAVLGGPGDLSLAFRVIDDARKTGGRRAVLIVDRANEQFARKYDGLAEIIALDVPQSPADRSRLTESLAAKMTAGGARFYAYDTERLVTLTNGRGLAVSDPHADARAASLLGDLAAKPFGLVIVEVGGIELAEHLSEISWALQRRGIALVAASGGSVVQGPFWRSTPGVDPAVLAQLARRSAIAIGASTNAAYLLMTYAPVICLYLTPGTREADFPNATATAAVESLEMATTRLPLGALLSALGESLRDRVCPDCGTTSGGLALTRNARWIACGRCPAVYPTPIAAA